ncbi:MAG: cohesin domain-containing protein [Candidatus Diapherotrites archaeon]|nr:cohesin domain-containing protein [Candidatus Diapherotrites archaeon]
MKRIFIALFFLLALPLAMAASDQLIARPSITINPVISGNYIEVNVSNAIDLYGAQFSLAYNPEIIKISSVAKGGFLESDKSQAFFFEGKQSSGLVANIIYLRLGKANGISGSGKLAAIGFTKLKDGDPGIRIENIILTNSKNEKIKAPTSVEMTLPKESNPQSSLALVAVIIIIVVVGTAAYFLTKRKPKNKK